MPGLFVCLPACLRTRGGYGACYGLDGGGGITPPLFWTWFFGPGFLCPVSGPGSGEVVKVQLVLELWGGIQGVVWVSCGRLCRVVEMQGGGTGGTGYVVSVVGCHVWL